MDDIDDDFDLEINSPPSSPSPIWNYKYIKCITNTPVYSKLMFATIVVLFSIGMNQMLALWLCIKDHGGPAVGIFLLNFIAIIAASFLMYAYNNNNWIMIKS
jgi:hypothetical protein